MKSKFAIGLFITSAAVFIASFLLFKKVADSVIGVSPQDTVECQKIYTKAKQCIDAEFNK
jgi:hypothetical protein